ncbi:MAG: SLBB domain-containing protein, partial [bacterium]
MENDIKNKTLSIILIFILVIIVSFYNLDGIFLKRQTENYKIKVYICGEVEKPGVYELNYNSRLGDLLLLAKVKDTADLQNINLAKKLKDEDFINSKDDYYLVDEVINPKKKIKDFYIAYIKTI